jgi:hypothetical protein
MLVKLSGQFVFSKYKTHGVSSMIELTPFNNDIYAQDEFRKLVEKYGIQTIVETGTYLGQTTPFLSELVKKVLTIEVNSNYYNQCHHLDSYKNIIRKLGNSPEVMKEMLPSLPKPILFFLDAHWGYDWPLLGELQTIANLKLNNSIIVVHDCKVPRKDFGFDSYNDQELTYEYVKEKLNLIYGDKYNHYYNEEATGSRRGVLYVTP